MSSPDLTAIHSLLRKMILQNQTPNSDPNDTYDPKRRMWIAVFCLVPSLLGPLASVLAFCGFTAGLITGEFPRDEWWLVLMTYTSVYAWIALFVMIRGWVKNQRVATHWIIFGSIAGIASAIITHVFSLMFVLPAIILAIYVVRFHWKLTKAVRRIP